MGGWINTFYGSLGTPYLTRVRLTPKTRWGQLYLHIFHRGDEDPDPHDHPWDFYTFPLQTYLEHQMGEDGAMYARVVPAFKLHYRPAEYPHRVVYPIRTLLSSLLGIKRLSHSTRLYTFVWRRGDKRREWGFWVLRHSPLAEFAKGQAKGHRCWVQWERYLDERSNNP